MAKRGFKVAVWACAAFVLMGVIASCVKEEERVVPVSDARIAFKASVNKEFLTRSVDYEDSGNAGRVGTSHFLFSFGEDSIYLRASEQRNTDQMFYVKDTAATQTKGAPIENPGSGAQNPLEECYVSAKLDNGQPYFSDDKVLVSTGKTSLSRYWPEQPLNFFAYAPQAAKTTDWNYLPETGSDGNYVWTGRFSYTMPEPLTGERAGNDAVNLPDYIYAIATGKEKTGGEVPIVFHHAFSAICFQIGTMPANITIKHIALNNIYTSGKCSYTEDTQNGIAFSWSSQTGQKSYRQDLNVNVNGDEAGSLGQGDAMTSNEQTFMVLPQTLPDDAEIEICFDVDGKEYTMTKEINAITTAWKADTKYVYAISIPEGVDIEITDVVNGSKKSGLEMENTGIATTYIRAAIVAYWIVEEGDAEPKDSYIVADWKESDGKFVWGENWDSYWKMGSDGYYYYKYPVERGERPAVPLFDEYELTAEPPVVNARLQMSIMVQAVMATAVEEAGWKWPSDFRESLLDFK